MARTPSNVRFAGRTQAEMLELIADSARTATAEAVAKAHALGLDTPGSKDGKLVALKPGGALVTLKR